MKKTKLIANIGKGKKDKLKTIDSVSLDLVNIIQPDKEGNQGDQEPMTQITELSFKKGLKVKVKFMIEEV